MVIVRVVLPKQSMFVPLAAFSLVSFGPWRRCWGVGGTIDKSAPPSTNHFSLRLVSVTCSRKQSFDSRPATLLTAFICWPWRFPP